MTKEIRELFNQAFTAIKKWKIVAMKRKNQIKILHIQIREMRRKHQHEINLIQKITAELPAERENVLLEEKIEELQEEISYLNFKIKVMGQIKEEVMLIPIHGKEFYG